MVEAGEGYCLHTINAFEEGNLLTFDLLLLDEPIYREYQVLPEVFTTVAPCRAVRYVVDLEKRTMVEKIAMEYDKSPDFPNVDISLAGQRYNDFWMLGISAAGRPGRKFFNQLAHGSWAEGGIADLYQAPDGEYLGGEPLFVPNPADHGEGVVINQHFMPERGLCEYVLFDAFAVRNGPIARIPLKYKVHPGLHTSFTPDRALA